MKPEEKVKYEKKKIEEMGLENYLRTRNISFDWWWLPVMILVGFVAGAIIL